MIVSNTNVRQTYASCTFPYWMLLHMDRYSGVVLRICPRQSAQGPRGAHKGSWAPSSGQGGLQGPGPQAPSGAHKSPGEPTRAQGGPPGPSPEAAREAIKRSRRPTRAQGAHKGPGVATMGAPEVTFTAVVLDIFLGAEKLPNIFPSCAFGRD